MSLTPLRSEWSGMTEPEEHTLIPMKGAPEPPSRTMTRREKERLARAAALVPHTPTGESAGDIIAAWVMWQKAGTGVPLPESVISRIGKQVKSLIATGYTTEEIKHGLSFWTISQLDNDMLSPIALDRFVWKWARDTRAGAREWCQTMRQQVIAYSTGAGVTPPGQSKADQRRQNSLRAIEEFTQR